MTDANPHQNTTPNITTRASTIRLRVGLALVAAVGLTSAAIVGSQLGDAAALDGSLDAVPYTRAQALDEAATNRSSGEVIQLTSNASALDATEQRDDGDGIIPSSDEVADTVGEIASTVGDSLPDVGRCILELLPDVFSGSSDTTSDVVDDATSACADLLPSADDFGAIDLGAFDLSDIDFGAIDMGGVDPTDVGLPGGFDVTDIDLSELADVELHDVSDLDTQFDDLDISSEVLDVVADVADEVVDFFKELPGNVRDRFDGLFGSD
jgi:hypothetical protein